MREEERSFLDTASHGPNVKIDKKMQNTSPNFGYMVQKCWTKVWTVGKRNFYNVLFCKFELSEMASV